jgi:hypothetical protein
VIYNNFRWPIKPRKPITKEVGRKSHKYVLKVKNKKY